MNNGAVIPEGKWVVVESHRTGSSWEGTRWVSYKAIRIGPGGRWWNDAAGGIVCDTEEEALKLVNELSGPA